MERFNPNDSIDTLELSVRARNGLMRAGYKTVASFLYLKHDELISIRNIGKNTLDEILMVQQNLLFGDGTSSGKMFEKDSIDACPPQMYTFRGIKGQDIPINESDLSVRAKNALQRQKYKWVSELLDLQVEDIAQFRNIGVKTADEIISFIEKSQSEPILIPEVVREENVDEGLIDQIEDYLYEQLIPLNCPVNPLRYVIRCVVKSKILACADLTFEEAISDPSLIDQILDDTLVGQYIEKMLIEQIQSNEFGTSLRGIQWCVPEIVSLKRIEKTLKKLEMDHSIMSESGIYRLARLSFLEAVEKIGGDRAKSIILMRITGMTLEQVGNAQGITRERVRQIESKTIKKIKDVAEDKYRRLYEKYNISKQEFISVFDETDTTFYYLSQKYEKGSKAFHSAVHDNALPIQLINKIEQAKHKDHIEIDGEYLECSRDALISYTLRNYCCSEVSIDQFVETYLDLVEKATCLHKSKLNLGDGAGLMNRLMDREDMLWKQNKRLRYYDLSSIDQASFYDRLNFSKYMDSTISTLKLFRENEQLMLDLDIRDEYELHNILRKTSNLHKKYKLTIQRMPTITIGNGNMQEQIYQTLLEHAPISIDNLAELCEHKYGIKSNTFKATQLKPFDRYYHDGMYCIDFKPLPLEVKHIMQKELHEDFYQLSNVYKKYYRLFPEQPKDLLNPYTIKELGFHVYSDYIVRDKYQNAQAFMYHALINEDMVNLDDLPIGLETKTNFCSVLASLKTSYDIIEYEPRKYVASKALEAKGVTKKMLKAFCDKVYNMYQGKGIFNLYSIRKNWGFQSIPNLNYHDKFYESLLEQDVRFNAIHIGSGHIFTTDTAFVKPIQIIKKIAEETGTLSLASIEVELRENYGLRPKRDKLIGYIKILEAEGMEG